MFRLMSKQDKATQKEKAPYIKQVEETCHAEKLLQAFQESRRDMGYSNDLKALVIVHQNAPKINQKT